jgi:hypothetical protein
MMKNNTSKLIPAWFSKKRAGFLQWFTAFFLLLGISVAAKFFFDGRSFVDEWRLIASQLAVTFIIALPVGFLMSGLSRGCIVCRDENTETEK